MVDVNFSEGAARDFRRLPAAIRPRVLRIVHRLGRWPDVSGARPLRGKLAGQYRIRTGDYRLQFLIIDGTVRIVKIGHRDGFYEE